jgi:pimeloyl-ACP methyl ester carboxylesterase
MADSEHWAELGAGRLRYLSAGSGPPLLLVHGLLGYAFSWRRVMPALAEHFKVHALDMLGFGFSDCPSNLDCSLKAHAQRLLEFMDDLEIAECSLIASSYGGAIAMMAASFAPNRFNRVVLAAPVNPWSPHGRLYAPFMSSVFIAPIFSRVYPYFPASAHKFFMQRMFGGPDSVPGDSLEGYRLVLRDKGVLRGALKTVRSWNQNLRRLEESLPKIQEIPILLIWGRKDRAVSVRSAFAMHQHLPHSQLVILENAGHLPYEEYPSEFTEAVLKFLDEH